MSDALQEPKTIWLVNRDEDGTPLNDESEMHSEGVTWSEDDIYGNGSEYILKSDSDATIERLEGELAKKRDTIAKLTDNSDRHARNSDNYAMEARAAKREGYRAWCEAVRLEGDINRYRRMARAGNLAALQVALLEQQP